MWAPCGFIHRIFFPYPFDPPAAPVPLFCVVGGNNLEYDPAIVAKVQAIIVRAVENGTISRARLEASWRRIMELKRQMP